MCEELTNWNKNGTYPNNYEVVGVSINGGGSGHEHSTSNGAECKKKDERKEFEGSHVANASRRGNEAKKK